MKKITTAILILVFGNAFAHAQFGGGSPYSAFGIGQLKSGVFGQTEAMAGSGIGLRSPAFLNLTNPAAFTSIDLPFNMMLDAGFNMQFYHLATNTEATNQQNGSFSHLVTWFRPHRKWATSVGLVPYSQVAYSVTTTRYLAGTDEQYLLNYDGEGGVNRLFWGNAVQLTPSWSIGGNINFLFGSLDEKEYFISNTAIGSFDVISNTHLRGLNVDLGTQWTIPVYNNRLTLGMTMTPGTSLFSKRTATLTSQSGELEEVLNPSEDYALPLKVGGGFAFAASQWTLTGDVTFEEWSAINLGSDVETVDTWTGSIGLEYAPFRNQRQDYFKTLLLRGGFRYRNSYLKINGNTFPDWLATLGVGIPIGRSGNHVNLNYAYNRNGTTDNGLILESKHQLSLSFSLRDVWFLKRKFN